MTRRWRGASRYVDVIEALNTAGLPTVFTQSGGMCAALAVQLETGRHLLITDAEDTSTETPPKSCSSPSTR